MITAQILTDHLNKVLKKENEYKTYYAGGTLCIDFPDSLVMLNFDSDSSYYGFDDKKTIMLSEEVVTKEVVKLMAAVYLKYKDPGHYFYTQAQEIYRKAS